MSTSDDLLKRGLGEPKPKLVQRLLHRKKPCPEADSIFHLYEPDYMGAAEFEHGILGEALVEACQRCASENWSVQPIVAGTDVTVQYVGPRQRLEAAARFIQTQLIEDGCERYAAEKPLKEVTCLRAAYLCRDAYYERLCGWWRLDLGHQFLLFKTSEDAEKCLEILNATDWKKFQATK